MRDPGNPGRYPLRARLAEAAQRMRFHVPGHFGVEPPGALDVAWQLDLTETRDLDSLGSPDGVLADLAARAAQAFGASEAWLSVQGATLPILAGLLAAVPPGGTLAAERHAHRSVLAAAVLGRFPVTWITGPWDPEWGLPLPAPPVAWASSPPPAVALLTVPTYEGLAGDVSALIANLHQRGAGVMVDAAHGSHWGRSSRLPRHPLAAGADWVVHGLHKTEPCLTQTGILLAREAGSLPVDEWWRRLGTSSPSYLLLASIEQYVAEREDGGAVWDQFVERRACVDRLAARAGLRILQSEWARRGQVADPAKLTIWGDGPALARALRDAGGEPEVVGLRSLTLVMGPRQPVSMAEWERVLETLARVPSPPAVRIPGPPAPRCWMAPATAAGRTAERVPLAAASGRIAARAATPYPPGIPLVMPGEEWTAEALDWVRAYAGEGFRVEGVERPARGPAGAMGEGWVWVVKRDG